jgi:hypothetical protein
MIGSRAVATELSDHAHDRSVLRRLCGGAPRDSVRTLVNGPLPAQPLPGWMILETFRLGGNARPNSALIQGTRCIASDGPRLKEK